MVFLQANGLFKYEPMELPAPSYKPISELENDDLRLQNSYFGND
jgi:hypothetical protein